MGIRVTKEVVTETAHRLINYDGKCAHIHGHRYIWQVTIEAESREATNNGMVVDFKELKIAMNNFLEPLDHALVLSEVDPLCKRFSRDELIEVFRAPNGEDPRLHIVPFNPTAEKFAGWIVADIVKQLPRMRVVQVRVYETATSYADIVFNG